MRKKMMRQGFTLIELLIVLAIIGVLMGIGIPVYTGQLDRAKARATAANMKTIAQAIANIVVLGGDDNIKLGTAGSTDLTSNIGDYAKGFDTTNYNASFTLSSNATVDIAVWYSGSDIKGSLIESAVGKACDEATFNGYGACVLKDVPVVSY